MANIVGVRPLTQDELDNWKSLVPAVAVLLDDGSVLCAGRLPALQPVISNEMVELTWKLNSYFSLGELRTLCFSMGLDHEEFYHGTKSELIQGMVRHCQRTNRLDELNRLARAERPKVKW